MKATELLKEDHSRVDRLFKKVKDTPKGEHPALFEQIKAELDVHTHIEETAFYPALLKKGKKDLQDITREGLEEHAQAKMFLAELASTTSLNKQYEAKLKVLMEDIEHHVKEEEDDMFPMVEDQFTPAALDKMGTALEKEKAKFIKTMTPDEQAALERSLKGSNEKGPAGKIYEKAVEVVGNILSGNGIAGETEQATTRKAPAAKKASSAGPGGNGTAKTSLAAKSGSSTKSKKPSADSAIRKTNVARASK